MSSSDEMSVPPALGAHLTTGGTALPRCGEGDSMTEEQPGDQQQTGVAAARARSAGRWVAGHGVEEALVAVPAAGAVALPVWWAQLPAAAAAIAAAGLWARHEWRTRRRVRQGERHHVVPAASRAAAALTSSDDEDDSDGPATGQQREVSSHG